MAAMLPMLMIRAGSSAVPALRSAGSSACTSQNGDFRLRSMTVSQAASGNVSNGSSHIAPALLTRMSRLPESAVTRLSEALTLLVPGQIGGDRPDVAEFGQLFLRLSARFCVA